MNRCLFSIGVLILLLSSCQDKKVELEILTQNEFNSSMRGIACFEEDVWRAGTSSVVEINGKSIKVDNINLDFRDLEVFSENEAVVMSSGEGCKMYRTEDKGQTWSLVYENDSTFLDGFDFCGDTGYAYADPIDSSFYIIKTIDAGKTWQELEIEEIPSTMLGEAGYAASGTGIKVLKTRYI